MNTNNLRKQKTIYYQWQKLRLEVLLAVVQREYEIFDVICKYRTETEKNAIEGIATHFNISSRQAYYLLGLELRSIGSLKYEELKKEYEKVLCYCQILTPNNKKL